MDAAGQVFGEKGVDAATGQEICQRAGVNTAAINYHFGGMQNLYEAVLVAAVQHTTNLPRLSKIAANGEDSTQQFHAVITMLVSIATRRDTEAWVIRVLLRELISPSPAFERLCVDEQVLPKGQIFSSIVANIMGLPADHPAVAQGCICVFVPWQMVIISPDSMLNRLFPAFDLNLPAEILIDRAFKFALGGLEALAKAEKARSHKKDI